MITVSVARDFTRYPSGRYTSNGTTSGQGFRERFLEAPLQRGESVTVDLDGTVGYGSSFLEEAFGGLVRVLKLPVGKLMTLLTIKTTDQSLVEEINEYISEAESKTK